MRKKPTRVVELAVPPLEVVDEVKRWGQNVLGGGGGDTFCCWT